MFIAINLADLTHYIGPDTGLLSPLKLLLQPVTTDCTVRCEGNRFDGVAILVDTNPERWDAIYEIIRNGCGNLKPIPKYKLRIYQSKTGRGGWKRI